LTKLPNVSYIYIFGFNSLLQFANSAYSCFRYAVLMNIILRFGSISSQQKVDFTDTTTEQLKKIKRTSLCESEVSAAKTHTRLCVNSGQPQQQQQLHLWYGGIKPTNGKHERLYSAAIELAIINRRSNIRQIVLLSHGLSIHDRTNSVMPPNSLPQNTCGWTDRHSTLEARALFDDHFIWFCANTIQGGPQIAELPTYH